MRQRRVAGVSWERGWNGLAGSRLCAGPRRTRGHSEIKRGSSVVSAGSDFVCLTARVLYGRGGLSAGQLTQTFAVA